MMNWRVARDEKKARKQFETANERFQQRSFYLTLTCLLIATCVHLSLYAINPRMHVRAMESAREGIVALSLPPEVQIPPPPQSIARPATPRVSALAEEFTIAPTTFEANPAENLPPPPASVKRQEKGRTPVYVPHDVAPRVLNGAEVATRLRQHYPRTLREAGIQGTVTLWVYVDAEGGPTDCLVHSSSGYPMFDEVAVEVAAYLRFAPATQMDKPVAVWIAQPFEFSLQRTRSRLTGSG